MTFQGIVLLDLIGTFVIGLMIHLVRVHKLHVFYAAVWFLAALFMMVVVSTPPLLDFVTVAVGARFPASALTLLAFVLVMGMLILFSMQLSSLAARQVKLAQAIALKELLAREQQVGGNGSEQ